MRPCSCGVGDGEKDIGKHAETCENRIDWEETKRTAIMIEPFKHVFCPMHGEPLRTTWPQGYPIFSVKAFQLLAGNPKVVDDCRRLHGLAEDAPIDNVKMLEPVFELKQMCCRLTKDQLMAMYVETRVGVNRRCRVCGKKRLGAPFRAANLGELGHVCFGCVVYSMHGGN